MKREISYFLGRADINAVAWYGLLKRLATLLGFIIHRLYYDGCMFTRVRFEIPEYDVPSLKSPFNSLHPAGT